MKKAILFVMTMILSSFMSFAQITLNNDEIAGQFDLKAAASLFGNSKSIEDFERQLNDESIGISNVDLNGDGYVDYLRCVETTIGTAHYIVIQACLAKEIYQDIATIYVDKDNNSSDGVVMQIVGDEYIYGRNYIVEPVYLYRPLIYNWLWSPAWVSWYSPYYYSYYPYWWNHHYCCHHDVYWSRIHRYHASHYCSFNHPHRPHGDMHHGSHHNGYAAANPGRSFNDRHPESVTNYRAINSSRQLKQPAMEPNRSRQSTPTRNINMQPTQRTQTRSSVIQPTQTSSGQQQRQQTINRTQPTRSGANTYQGNRNTNNINRSSSTPSRSMTAPRTNSSAPSRSSGSFNSGRPSGSSAPRSSGSTTSRSSSSSPSRSSGSAPSRSGGRR